jgi:hypothetical protein
MKKIKKVFLSILFVILSFSFTKVVFANQSFSENFDSLENWDFIPSSIGDTDSWKINDGVLTGSISNGNRSFLFSKIKDFGEDFRFNFDATNISGIDEEVLFGVSQDRSNYYVLNTRFSEPLWTQDLNINQVVLWKYIDGQYHELKRVDVSKDFNLDLLKNTKYQFNVVVQDKKIDVYIKNILILSFLDEDLLSGGVGFWNHGGDFYKAKTINLYDNLVINCTDCILPSNTPKKKIFVLPGLGASWNSNAIVYNQQVSDNSWKMTPFVNNYDGLIEDLEKNGLVKDQDFFVWNYDWRRPISEIEDKFNNFLNSKNISNNDEIYLVGHSLGGIVARLWGQDHPGDQRLKKITELGSPNMGSLDTYSVWNGGIVSDSKSVSSVAFQILLNLQNKNVTPDLNKLRSYAPIAKDLLPTFDNYVLKNGKVLDQSKLETKNTFLPSENNKVSNVSDKLSLSVGIGFSTPNLIKLTDRSIFDKALGLWPDGRLVGYKYSVGDGTVLKNSASFGSVNLVEKISDHGEIVNKSLDFIMSNLGLENKNIDFKYSDNFSDSLVVFVGSPATVSLKCGNDTFEENDGFVVVKNKKYNECILNLNPTGNGVVHLVLGNTNNNDWNYIEKNVTLNNPEKVIINFNNGNIKTDKRNKDFLISWIRTDLLQLGLDKAVRYLEKGDLKQVINTVFVYRSKTKETIISQRILDNLFILGSIDKPNKRFFNYRWMYMNRDYLSNKIKMNHFSVLSFEKLEKLIDRADNDMKNENCPDEEIIKSFSDGYSSETLGN